MNIKIQIAKLKNVINNMMLKLQINNRRTIIKYEKCSDYYCE